MRIFSHRASGLLAILQQSLASKASFLALIWKIPRPPYYLGRVSIPVNKMQLSLILGRAPKEISIMLIDSRTSLNRESVALHIVTCRG